MVGRGAEFMALSSNSFMNRLAIRGWWGNPWLHHGSVFKNEIRVCHAVEGVRGLEFGI